MYFDFYRPGRPTRWAITFACQLAFVLFGYDQGVFSGIIGNEHFLRLMGEPNDTLTGLIVSVYNLGCFTGCIINFFIGDWLGRRRAMWFAMLWIIVCRSFSLPCFTFTTPLVFSLFQTSLLTGHQIGATLQCSAYGRGQMIAGRFIAGWGTGIETSTVFALHFHSILTLEPFHCPWMRLYPSGLFRKRCKFFRIWQKQHQEQQQKSSLVSYQIRAADCIVSLFSRAQQHYAHLKFC